MKYQLIVRTTSGIEKELRNSKTNNLLTALLDEEGYLSKQVIANMLASSDFERFDEGDTIAIEAV